VNVDRSISCTFHHFPQCDTDFSLLSFVPARFLSLIHSPLIIAFRVFLTYFVPHWLQFGSEDSQNCDLLSFDLTSLAAFRFLALHSSTHCFDPSALLSCYETSGSRVDFHSGTFPGRIRSLLGLEFVSESGWQVRWPVMCEKVGTNSLHSD
jgi:hypothetical protein